MRWSTEKPVRKRKTWQKCFMFLPLTIDKETVWLEFVERQEVWDDWQKEYHWEYRLCSN